MSDRVATYRPTLDEVMGGEEWSTAERRVLESCRVDGFARVGPDRPEEPSDTNRVRAGLIRFLLLGGDGGTVVPHPRGVRIAGAWIEGRLDFGGCMTTLELRLKGCRFQKPPTLWAARIGGLDLSGSVLPGLNLHRIKVAGNVHLRCGFRSEGLVDLNGAQIDGALDCSGGQFVVAKGKALHCGAARIGASVFLRDGFIATGEVNFVRAEVTGNLRCGGGQFDGAFVADAMRLGDGLFWTRVTGQRPEVNLTQAHVGLLHDDWHSWEGVQRLSLSGFAYDRLDKPLSVAQRLDWLAKSQNIALTVTAFGGGLVTGSPESFDPKPYTQLARILARDGYRQAAAQVLEMREDRLSKTEYDAALAGLCPDKWAMLRVLRARFRRCWDRIFKVLFGYGHMPARSLLVALGIWLFSFCLYGQTYASGQMAPNSAVILTSQDWIDAVNAGCPVATDPGYVSAKADGCQMPLTLWEASASYKDFETFSGWLYALDLFLPLDSLAQQEAWAPSKDRGNWGRAGFYLRFVIQLSGWLIAAVGAAVVTGLVGRRDE